MSQGWKRVADAAEVGLRLLDDAAQLLEDGAIAVDDVANLRLERNSTQSLPPRDPLALHRTVESSGECRRVVGERERVVRVGAGDRAEKKREVGYGPRQRARHRQW